MSLVQHSETDDLTGLIIGAAIEVHRHLGPGLLESVYVACLACELESQRVDFQRQKRLPLFYKGRALNSSLTVDLMVGSRVIVEVKSVDHLAPVHQAQLLTYLRMTGCPAGLLVNFNVPVLKNGVRRVLNTRRGGHGDA